MTNYFYDAAHPLPAAGTNATLELADAGTTFIGLAVTSTSGIALQAALKQRIMIGADGSIHAGSYALDLKGAASGVYNEGAITSDTASALHFSGGGIGSVTNLGTITGAEAIEIASTGTADKLDLYNSGTISASGVAIVGGAGDDRIVNVGTLKTTATAAGALAIDLGAGNDFYDGSQGSITGVIQLGAGNDTAYGGAGDETFIAGTGSNHIDGGGGYHDTVDYSFASTAVTLDLHTTNLQWTGAQFDQILNVENIVGSAQADKLTGSDISNSLTGGAGDDTLDGGLGNDTLDGGAGVDTVRYSGSFAVTVSLAVSGDQDTGVNGHDTLIGIENLEGGAGADKLTGSDGANLLKGGSGNDTLTGGLGNDTLDGGSGQDTAVFSGLKSAYTITTNTDGTFTVAGPDGTDTLKDVRLAKFDDQTVALTNGAPSSILLLAGSVSEDTAPNTTVGTLYGSDPDGDTLTYSLMSDGGGHFALNGSSLVLTGKLDYETAKQHVVTVLARDTYGLTMAKSFTIAVKNVIEKTPLTVKGTSHDDLLSGEAGNDKVYGLRGDDTLWGDAGNDRLTGGLGNDTLIGGAGKDLFVLDYKPNVKSNVDFFYDFNPKYDTIGLSRKVFSKIHKKVTKGAFWIGDHVHDKDDRLLYNKKTGALFYDPDGTGHAAAIQIAELPKKLHITYKDFILV